MVRLLIVACLLLASLPASARDQKAPEAPTLLTVLRSLFSGEQKKTQTKPARTSAPRTMRPEVQRPGSTRNPARKATAQAGCDGQLVKSAYYSSGRRTASGEPFNPHGMTAAHRTLPFGTRLTVTHPRTGQSTTVRINDRGPFVRGVSLDLSLGAAKAIGMRGTEHVCIS